MTRLAGKRILLVEDEFFIAEMTAMMLADHGAEVVGPAFDLAEGLRLAEQAGLDAGVLDMNLNGEQSVPIASALAASGVPFLFVTGYARVADQPFAAPMLGKPIDERDLVETLLALLATAEG